MRPTSTTDGVSTDGRRLRVLHVITNLGPANAQFNEHCLPMRRARDITICSVHERTVNVPHEISVFEGDGTARGLARALRRAFDHGPYDIVHAHAPGTATVLALVVARSRRSMTNAVLTVHNSRESFPMRNQALLPLLFRMFPTVVFCSHAAAGSYPRWMRALTHRTEIVPNGVDTARIGRVVETEASLQPSSFRVTTVGRLIPRKDPITVYEAFRAATDGPDGLLYVGDGIQRTDVAARVARHGLDDRVEITGLVERDEVYRLLARSSLVVSAAHSEGLPVAVLEALACGVPVVLSDIPPHREIADGVDFVPLVPPGDVPGFAAAIREAKTMSPADRAEVGARGRSLVERRFGLRVMHESYERVYRSVLVPRHGAGPGRSPEVAA